MLAGTSAAFEPERVTAVIGPNGAGKSTLLRVLAGVARPSAGRVLLDGRAMEAVPRTERARRVAYVSQRAGVAFAFSTRAVVGLGRYAAGGAGEAVARALEAVDLAGEAEREFGALSAGQQQRASLARALAQLGLPGGERGVESRYLILDEPVSAMDPSHALDTMELLRRVSRGAVGGGVGGAVGVVVVLHDLALASRYADRVVALGAGGVVRASGGVGETLTPEVLEGLFGVRFGMAAVDGAGEGIPVVLGRREVASERR